MKAQSIAAAHQPAGGTFGHGFRLNGAKALVVDGHTADLLIVAGRTAARRASAAG